MGTEAKSIWLLENGADIHSAIEKIQWGVERFR